MNVFTEFEREVLRRLLRQRLETEQIDSVLNSASQVSYEHTGAGYFLTVRHPMLPAERIVCSEPFVIGKAGDVSCGFVAFVEGGELTLDCHGWGSVSMPDDFRTRHVEIEDAAK